MLADKVATVYSQQPDTPQVDEVYNMTAGMHQSVLTR